MVNGNSDPKVKKDFAAAAADDNSNCDKSIGGKGVGGGGIIVHSEAKRANNGHSNSVEARNNR